MDVGVEALCLHQKKAKRDSRVSTCPKGPRTQIIGRLRLGLGLLRPEAPYPPPHKHGILHILKASSLSSLTTLASTLVWGGWVVDTWERMGIFGSTLLCAEKRWLPSCTYFAH